MRTKLSLNMIVPMMLIKWLIQCFVVTKNRKLFLLKEPSVYNNEYVGN